MRPAAAGLALTLTLAGLPAARAESPDPKPTPSPYEAIDRHALAAPAAAEKSVATLSAYLSRPAKTDREKARAIFRWLTDRIGYNAEDFLAGKPPGDCSAEAVLKTRKTVCAGYAALFEALARPAGLEAVTIEGGGKGYGYVPGEDATDKNHAWNAVKVGGRWYGVDATWGAGSVDAARGFVKELNEEWFLAPPDQLILSHFPADPARQFLARPVDAATFRRWPKVPSQLFAFGFEAKAVREVLDGPDFRGLVEAFGEHGGRVRVRKAPVARHLAAGTAVTLEVEATGGGQVAVINAGEWRHAKPAGGVSRFTLTPKAGSLQVSAKYPDKGDSYWTILKYVVE